MCHEVGRVRQSVIRHPWMALGLALVLAVISSVTMAGDWTMFRGDSALLGVSTDAQIPDQPRLLWQVETVDGVASTPVILGENVYVGTVQGDLLCLKLADGKEVWKYQSLPNAKPNELRTGE